jgi:hypothetical protein
MAHRLKVLALATFVALALSAAASVATSAGAELHSEAKDTTLTGNAVSMQRIQWGFNEIACKELSFETTMAKQSTSELTFTPSYGCTVQYEENSFVGHVDFKSCAYVFSVTELTKEGGHGPASIECEKPTDEIRLSYTVSGFNLTCLTFPAQAAGSVDYINQGSGSGRDIKILLTLAGLKYTASGKCGSGAGEGATIQGEITMAGEDAKGAPLGIWVE